jgi:hypothetical protein
MVTRKSGHKSQSSPPPGEWQGAFACQPPPAAVDEGHGAPITGFTVAGIQLAAAGDVNDGLPPAKISVARECGRAALFVLDHARAPNEGAPP